MRTDEELAAARAAIASRQAGEFETTRPTPTQAEHDLLALMPASPLAHTPRVLTMLKEWDLSPIDESSFDPTEPPGRPPENGGADAPGNGEAEAAHAGNNHRSRRKR